MCPSGRVQPLFAPPGRGHRWAFKKEAFEAVAAGELERAQHLMFDHIYDRNKSKIMEPIKQFQQLISQRALRETNQARQRATMLLWASCFFIFLFT